MTTLERTHRQQLEKVIKEARVVAEIAASAVLTELGVGDAKAPAHLSSNDKDLRRRLRIHGRQLGDQRDDLFKTQETVRLKEEIAYEHWHRMLFARFLAENSLLMYPDDNNPIPITLEECEELAIEQGLNNGWEVAAQYAAKMLPQIFRISSPVFELKLPKNRLGQLEQLLTSLPDETFLASDSLGWVYQYWQAKRKEEVNASEVKIGARELPVVTQLFTEDYMVSFLLDNSLGAWWAAKKLGITDEKIGVEAENEDELRNRASIPGVPLEYLRFVQLENGSWIPAAGTFEQWPNNLSKLKTLDPCCGSGHFLVGLLHMLVPMRMELEELSTDNALDLVLRENLFGLEIDPRCVEIAAFSVALTVWTYPGSGGFRNLPGMNIACSGLPIAATKSEWRSIAKENRQLSNFLDYLYMIFKDAPVLGSLANPTWAAQEGELFEPEWDVITSGLDAMIEREQTDIFHSIESRLELAVAAGGLGKTAKILSQKFQLVTTNVPYLGGGLQTKTLRTYCEKHFSEAKNDLATVFLNRCLELCDQNGSCSLVLPQNWLFLTGYKNFRETLLKNSSWNFIARLGAHGFQTPMWDFNVQLLVISPGNLKSHTEIRGVDVSTQKSAIKKSKILQVTEIKTVKQERQLDNPDSRIMLEEASTGPLLSQYAETGTGLQTFDRPRFISCHWEIARIRNIWLPLQSAPSGKGQFTGVRELVRWENGCGTLFQFMQDKEKYDNYKSGIWKAGSQFWSKKGVIHSVMADLPHAGYQGYPYDTNGAVLIPKNGIHAAAIWTFSFSGEFHLEVRKLDQKLWVTNATFLKVPFDLEYWTKIALDKYPNGLPQPFSDDPTQWIFHGHPCGSVVWDEGTKWTTNGKLRTDDTVLQIAVARLLGYRYPAELDPEMDLADEQREWVNQGEELLPLADDDGIVCIPSVRGEATAADRLLKLLVKSYGDKWNNQTLSDLLIAASAEGRTLDTWLRDYFFTQHVKLFKHRPFVWHIWDGLVDGFSVLVNYHKLDQKLLETLIYDYLGDWISRQRRDISQLIPGAEEKLAAAEVLKKRLELILNGEQPYDIFVRWKSLDQQAIGWDPDLNDGVRLNIRPFMSVPDIKKRGAGVLRDKPNIHWRKDRGKDVSSAPWYHLGPKYEGKEADRINDHHLSLAEKKAVRDEI